MSSIWVIPHRFQIQIKSKFIPNQVEQSENPNNDSINIWKCQNYYRRLATFKLLHVMFKLGIWKFDPLFKNYLVENNDAWL